MSKGVAYRNPGDSRRASVALKPNTSVALEGRGEEVVVVVPEEGTGTGREQEPAAGRTLWDWLKSLIEVR